VCGTIIHADGCLPTLDIPPAQERVEQVWLNRFGHLVHFHLCAFGDVANHHQPIGTLVYDVNPIDGVGAASVSPRVCHIIRLAQHLSDGFYGFGAGGEPRRCRVASVNRLSDKVQLLCGVRDFLQRAVVGEALPSLFPPNGVGDGISCRLALLQNHHRRSVGSALKGLKRNHVVNMENPQRHKFAVRLRDAELTKALPAPAVLKTDWVMTKPSLPSFFQQLVRIHISHEHRDVVFLNPALASPPAGRDHSPSKLAQ
jgi:hypothetical protein